MWPFGQLRLLGKTIFRYRTPLLTGRVLVLLAIQYGTNGTQQCLIRARLFLREVSTLTVFVLCRLSFALLLQLLASPCLLFLTSLVTMFPTIIRTFTCADHTLDISKAHARIAGHCGRAAVIRPETCFQAAGFQ